MGSTTFRSRQETRKMYDIEFVPFARPYRIGYMVVLVIVALAWVGWPGLVLVTLSSVDLNVKD